MASTSPSENDIGGESYDHPNGYMAWDGNSLDWYVFDETAWGDLYLALEPRRGEVRPVARDDRMDVNTVTDGLTP